MIRNVLEFDENAIPLPAIEGVRDDAIDVGGRRVVGVADPTSPQDAATKKYVDELVVKVERVGKSAQQKVSPAIVYSDGGPGPEGPAGPPGADGVQGIQGIQGSAGADGVDGLDGPPGADGVQGIQGIQGPAGADGLDGAAGPNTVTTTTTTNLTGIIYGNGSVVNAGQLSGDVTTSGSSLATTIPNNTVTYAKMQDVSATNKILGRSTAGAGDVEEIACTAAGRALIDDVDAAAQRTTLGLGTAAVATATVLMPTGAILDYGASSIPTGWLACDGAAVSRTTYADLFTAIGTTWGVGDGSTTFNVPDLRGRAAIGSGTGTGLSARTLAATGGTETHQLTTAEMPSHTHPPVTTSFFCRTSGGALQVDTVGGANSYTHQSATGSTGGDGSHNNMQPFRVVTKIIKV